MSPCQAHIWGKKAIFTSRRQFPCPCQGWKEIHSGGMQSISLPCACSQQKTTPSDQLTCLSTGEPNRESNGAMQTILGLHDDPRGSNTHLPRKQHGPSNPQQCIILIQTKISQSHGWTHVHGQKEQHTLQQWRRPQYLANNPSSHVIHSGGRIGCPICQYEYSHLDAPKAHGTWPPTTMHTNANRQRNSTCATHQQNITKKTQGHEYALLLAKMPQHIGPILLLLETRNTELGRLLHQASTNQPPQICLPHKPNIQWTQSRGW